MSKYTIFILLTNLANCYPEPPECRYSDECEVNTVCNEKRECVAPFPLPLGPLLQGSVTTPCVVWNSSFAGIPHDLVRSNLWCLSGTESPVPCKEIPTWMMVCN